MKNKNLTFIPGEVITSDESTGCESMPQITLTDGSAILLGRFDPKCESRQHKRFAQRLPTLDTRNELGALFAAAPDLLAALKKVKATRIYRPLGDTPQAVALRDMLDAVDAAIAKATQTP